jgi:hypothetical protein
MLMVPASKVLVVATIEIRSKVPDNAINPTPFCVSASVGLIACVMAVHVFPVTLKTVQTIVAVAAALPVIGPGNPSVMAETTVVFALEIVPFVDEYPLLTKPLLVPILILLVPAAAKLISLAIRVMRLTQEGTPVKSMVVPDGGAIAVPETMLELKPLTATVPVPAGRVSVPFVAVLGSCKVTLPPLEEFNFRLMGIL